MMQNLGDRYTWCEKDNVHEPIKSQTWDIVNSPWWISLQEILINDEIKLVRTTVTWYLRVWLEVPIAIAVKCSI